MRNIAPLRAGNVGGQGPGSCRVGEVTVRDQAAAGRVAFLLAGLFLLSCAAAGPANAQRWDLGSLALDPLLCTTITLRKQVPVTKEIIHEPSFMGNRFLIALRYREGGDEKGYTPNLAAGYANVSLVSEVEVTPDIPLLVHRRWCVIEMWRFHPEADEKLCMMWTLGDRGAELKVLQEDLGGRFLAERILPLKPHEVSRLIAFFRQMTRAMVDSLKEPPPST